MERLPGLLRARPVTLAVWSFCHGRRSLVETLAQVAEVTELAEAAAARAAYAVTRNS